MAPTTVALATAVPVASARMLTGLSTMRCWSAMLGANCVWITQPLPKPLTVAFGVSLSPA